MKKLHEELKSVAEFSFDFMVEAKVQGSVILALYYNQLVALEKATGANACISSSGITFIAKSQEEVKTFRQIFGLPGQIWSRTPHYSGEGLVYFLELPHPAPYYAGETLQISVSTKELPPSCIIVYEEVEEPAKRVKRAKVVCNTTEENVDDEDVTSA